MHNFGRENAYSVCFHDPERTTGAHLSKAAHNESYFVLFDQKNGLLTHEEWAPVFEKEVVVEENDRPQRIQMRWGFIQLKLFMEWSRQANQEGIMK